MQQLPNPEVTTADCHHNADLAAGRLSSSAHSRASCARESRHTAPLAPFDASADSPPARQHHRHSYADFVLARS